MRVHVVNEEVQRQDINSVEGLPMHGVSIKLLLSGEKALLIESHLKKGAVTPDHLHRHESLCYIVSGRVRAKIGEKVKELGPGDAFLHPIGVSHAGEALEDTVWIEVKAPPEKTW